MSTHSSSPVPLPTDKELVLKVIPMPADCNANGDIFGGWVMAQVDLAGSVIPARHAQGRMATVAVNEFVFKQPVRVGDTAWLVGGPAEQGQAPVTPQDLASTLGTISYEVLCLFGGMNPRIYA